MAPLQFAYVHSQTFPVSVRTTNPNPSISVVPSDPHRSPRRRRRRRVPSLPAPVPVNPATNTNGASVQVQPLPSLSPSPIPPTPALTSLPPHLPSIYFSPTSPPPFQTFPVRVPSPQKSPTFSYNMTLKTLARKKNSLPQCLDIVQEMRRTGIRPDKFTYSALLTSCFRSKARHTAAELYHEIRKDGVPLDHYLRANLLKIAASGPSPQIDLCVRLFHGDPHPNRVMCNVMMDAYANIGALNNCISTYRYMAGAGVLPDSYTVTALMKAYIRSGRLEDAVTNLREIYKSGLDVPVVAFSQLIDAYGKQGLMDRAVELYDMMTAWHIEPSQITFNALIGACVHSGNVERAVEIYEEMKHTSNFPGDRYTYHGLMKCCLRRGDGEAALKWYHYIKTTPFQCNQVSFRQAFLAAGQSLNLDAVYDIARDMKEGGAAPREDTVATGVAACIRCSDLKGAAKFFKDYAQVVCEKCPDKHPHLKHFFNNVRKSMQLFEPNERGDNADYMHTMSVVDEMERTWQGQSAQ